MHTTQRDNRISSPRSGGLQTWRNPFRLVLVELVQEPYDGGAVMAMDGDDLVDAAGPVDEGLPIGQPVQLGAATGPQDPLSADAGLVVMANQIKGAHGHRIFTHPAQPRDAKATSRAPRTTTCGPNWDSGDTTVQGPP